MPYAGFGILGKASGQAAGPGFGAGKAGVGAFVAPATKLAFSQQPIATGKSIAFPTQPIVWALSASGAIDTNYTGPVTIAITGGTGGAGALLTGTATVTAVAGIATFGNLAIDTGWANYNLTATSGGLTSAMSGAFDVAALYASMTQADSTTTLPAAETGQTWTQASGVWGTLGNRAYVPANTVLAKAYVDSGLKNAKVTATVQGTIRALNNFGDPLLTFRGIDSANFLWIEFTYSAFNIGKTVAGVYTTLTYAVTIPGSPIPTSYVFQDATDYAVSITLDEDRIYVQINGDDVFSYILLPADATTFNVAGATLVGMANDVGGTGTGARWKNISVVPVVDTYYGTQTAMEDFAGTAALAGTTTDVGGFTWTSLYGSGFTNASGVSSATTESQAYIASGNATGAVETRASATFLLGGVSVRAQDSTNFFDYIAEGEIDGKGGGSEGKLYKYGGSSTPAQLSASQLVVGTPVMRVYQNGNRLFTERDGIVDAVWTDPALLASASHVGVVTRGSSRVLASFRQYSSTGPNTGGTTLPALVVLVGNSFVAGTQNPDSGKMFTHIKRDLGFQYDYVDFASSGAQTSEFFPLVTKLLQPLYDPTRPANIIILSEMINHWSLGGVGTIQAQLAYQRLASSLRAIGFLVLAMTLTPSREMGNDVRPGINTWMRTNYTNFADGLADMAADVSTALPLGNVNPFMYHSDINHPIVQGQRQYAQTIADALKRPPFNLGTVTYGAATKLGFVTQPANATAGVAFGIPPRLAVMDVSGNVVANYTGSVTLSINVGTGTGGATLIGTLTAPIANGYARFGAIGIDTTGTGYTLHATTGTFTADSTAFNVTAASALNLVSAMFPGGPLGGPQLQGHPFYQQPAFVVQNSAGLRAIGYVGNVTLSISAGGTLSGTTTIPVVGGIAQYTDISATGTAGTTYTLTAAASGVTSVTQTVPLSGVAVNTVDGFVRADSSTTLGSPDTGNPYRVVQGTWGIASNAGKSVSDVNGDIVMTETGHKDGSYGLTVTGQCSSATNYRIPALAVRGFTINGATSYLYTHILNGQVVLGKKTTANANAILLATAAVATPDSTNATLVITYNGPVITVSVNGSVLITYVLTIDENSVFSSYAAAQIGIVWLKVGSPTIAASFTALSHTGATPSAATKLVFTGQPGDVSKAGQFTTLPILTVQDAGNNVVSSYTGNVTFSISSGTLTGTVTIPVTNGACYPYDLGVTNGSPLGAATLTATCGGLTSATSSSFNILLVAVTDTFIAQNGTLLSTRTANNGNTWQAFGGAAYRTVTNYATSTSANAGNTQWTGVDTGKADGTFQIDVPQGGVGGGLWLAVRGSNATNYLLFGFSNSTTMRIYKAVNGSFIQVAIATVTAPTTAYTLRLVTSGSSLTGYIGQNGVYTQYITGSDAFNSTATIAGMWAQNSGTAYANFRAV